MEEADRLRTFAIFFVDEIGSVVLRRTTVVELPEKESNIVT